MKKILTIILLLVMSAPALACNNCDTYWKKRYEHLKYEQKYRFKHQIRETAQQGRLRLMRMRQYQRARRRAYYRRGAPYRGSLYSMRACPR